MDLPHVRGDEPTNSQKCERREENLPHVRGDEPFEFLKFDGFSCHLPHVRGDEPTSRCIIERRSKICPTCVGMNRRGNETN